MLSLSEATWCCILTIVFMSVPAYSYALNLKAARQAGNLRLEPSEAIVFPGDNVTFTCTNSINSSFIWDFTSMIQGHDVEEGSYSIDGTVTYFSKLHIYLSTRIMSGEITCSVSEDGSKVFAFFIINGVRNGGSCQTTSDCVTDKAICQNKICECPNNHIRLRVKERGYDVCREMIYSLYDACDYDEQCAHLVDPRSICKSVCVCAPWARDRRGRCVPINEITYNRSQEMYRVGLIAVTCIIILIVAISLWVTLKRSCHDQNSDGQRRSITQTDQDSSNISITEIPFDKPPAYDELLTKEEDTIANPPNFKDALKHCMTAKRLIRQVSAPAGELLPSTGLENLKSINKTSNES